MEDRYQHGRGVALADFNGDRKTDIVYGNWMGPHRLFLQGDNSQFRVRADKVHTGHFVSSPAGRIKALRCSPLQNIASRTFAVPSPIRTVIVADFDNDQQLDVFFNNIAYRGDAPNKLFRCRFFKEPSWLFVNKVSLSVSTNCSTSLLPGCRVSRRAGADPLIQQLNVGNAAEPSGRGTGRYNDHVISHSAVKAVVAVLCPGVFILLAELLRRCVCSQRRSHSAGMQGLFALRPVQPEQVVLCWCNTTQRQQALY